MTHETILKRDNGDKYKITVSVFVDMMKHYWSFGVYHCPAGKRKFTSVCDTGESLTLKRLPKDQQQTIAEEKYLQHVTAAEVQAAKLELWNQIKPTI